MTTGFIMSKLICVISMEFLPLSHRCSSMRNVPSGEERGETCFRRLMCQWLLQSPNRVLACRIGYKFLGNINQALIKICILLVNLEPENGETGLHLAACKNNEKMISFLLDLGASPNMVDLKGRSPAMRAAEFGHVQALTLLTEADTDLTSKEFNIIFVWNNFIQEWL